MQVVRAGRRMWLLSSVLLMSFPILVERAQASSTEWYADKGVSLPPHAIGSRTKFAASASHAGSRVLANRSYGISCVPYARQVSGIQVVGNAWQWWGNAAGVYSRGDRPEVGSVLNFRANGRMHLGHVAVVTRVVNPREVVIDHANWPSGGRPGV